LFFALFNIMNWLLIGATVGGECGLDDCSLFLPYVLHRAESRLSEPCRLLSAMQEIVTGKLRAVQVGALATQISAHC